MNNDALVVKRELENTRQEYWNIDPAAGELLQSLLFTHQPKHILEIGTSNGYSTILLAEIAAQYEGHITSVEFHEKRIVLARENLERAKLSEYVTILQGDALEALSFIQQGGRKFDFFFIDANKKQYGEYFKKCLELANPKAIIVADNTVSHRNKLDDFFEIIKKEPTISVLELNIGTGLVIARLK